MLKKIALFLVLMFVPFMVNAQTEHFYSEAGDDINLKEDINGSTAIAGMNVTFDNLIRGIALGAGNEVVLTGEVDYAVFAGNEVNIEGKVNNDAFIAGNLITASSSAQFKRDVIIAGNSVELSGDFARNVSVYANKVEVKGASVAGNLKLHASNIKIDGATALGNLMYPEDASVDISEKAKINNTVKMEVTEEEPTYFNVISSKVLSFVCYAFFFAIICLLFPKLIEKLEDRYQKMGGSLTVEIIAKGLIALILVPVIALILLTTVIGVPIGIVLIALYFIAMYLSTIFTAYVLGYKIWQKVFNKDMNMLLIGLIGLFVLLILNIIPGVRYLVAFITIVFGLGVILDHVLRTRSK